jgi:hypothetical protein
MLSLLRRSFVAILTSAGTTVFALERLQQQKTGEDSMFASDLSGHQDWMLGLRRPEGLRFVRQGFQP